MLRKSIKSVPKSFATKGQVQAKIQQSIEELCDHHPKMTMHQEQLDDSLTSLQWLWNLNVNINQPIDSTQSLEIVEDRTYTQNENAGKTVLNQPRLCQKQRFQRSKKSLHCLSFPAAGDDLCLCNQQTIEVVPNNHCGGTNHFGHRYSGEKCVTEQLQFNPVVSHKTVDTQNTVDDTKHHFQKCIGPLLSDAAQPHQFNSSKGNRTDVHRETINYKTNAYIRPPFTFISLICMALQKAKRNRMTASSICKWIKDNYIYYRYVDSLCQKSVEETLAKNKCFSKIQRKTKQPGNSPFWQITPSEQITHLRKKESSVDSQLNCLDSMKPRNVVLQISGRKRKQPSPQKLICNKSYAKTRKHEKMMEAKQNINKNLLQEQAPELGSLKGDFNWNSVFDDIFGDDMNEETTPATISVVNKSVSVARPINLSLTVSEPTHSNQLVSQNVSVEEPNNENNFARNPASNENELDNTLIWDTSNKEDGLFDTCAADFAPFDLEHIDGEKGVDNLLIDVGDIDLTITGRQIEPPPEWVPVSGDIDAILCEKQDDNLKPELLESKSSTLFNSLLFENSVASLSERKLSNKSQDFALEASCSIHDGTAKLQHNYSTTELLRGNSAKPKWRCRNF